MRRFILAEYCEGPFYMGWWLYVREKNDGSPNHDRWDNWGWLRRHCEGVRRLCESMGHLVMPEIRAGCDRFAEWFAGTYPHGLLVECDYKSGPYQLVEVVKRRPKQIRRSIIRTVARANRSFEKACAEYAESSQGEGHALRR